MQMRCLYCNKEKPIEEFSDEHVIPKAIGGNIEPVNPFKLTNVCKRCNRLCGLFVDAPFIRSCFTQNNRANSAFRALKPGQNAALPLTYIGVLDDLACESRICEYWLGPTDDSVYHFHEPYPTEPNSPAIVGVPPHLPESEIDFGFVFLFVRSNNPLWWPVIFQSVNQQFEKAILYLGNGPPPNYGRFDAVPVERQDILESLKAMVVKNTVIP